MKRRQKWIHIGPWQCVVSLGCGVGFGAWYHNSNLTLYLGPLVVDMDVPTRVWRAIARHEAETKSEPR